MTEQRALTRTARSGLASSSSRGVKQQVPAFLNKLYSMVNDTETDDLIYWADDGQSFFIPHHERFGRELLPRFFKHGNFASFVRQLNMYGFHKVRHLQQGVLQNETETELWQFESPHFQRGQPDLLLLIQRKKAHGVGASAGGADELDQLGDSTPDLVGGTAGAEGKALDVSVIASSLAAIKRHQAAISTDLKDLQESNSALWTEAVAARERHKKHQDTINRILKFLAGVFGSAAGGSMASGGRVRDHDEDVASSGMDAMNSSSDPSGSVALIPRKRQRLMIEDGAGDDSIHRQSSANTMSAKPRVKTPPKPRLEVSSSDDWSADNLLTPMELDDTANARISAEPLTPAAIESVSTSPAASTVPPTPRGISTSDIQVSPWETSNPSNDGSLTAPLSFMNPLPSSFPYPPSSDVYPLTSGQPLPMVTDPSSQTFNNLSPSDLAAFQSLMSQPDAFQKLMSAMSKPGGLPVIPQPSTLNPPAQPTYSSTYPMDYSPSGYAFDSQLASNSGGSGTLVPSTSSNYSGMGQQGAPDSFPPLNNGFGTYDPDAFLSLLSGNGIGNDRGIESGMTDLELANTLNAQTSGVARAYTDANAINAEVDSIQNSINSLIEQMGLDPATLSQMNEAGSVAPLELPSHFTTGGDTNIAVTTSTSNAWAPTTDPATPKTSMTDDGGTNASESPRSSMEVPEEQTSPKALKPRSGKRRASAMETDLASREAGTARSQRISRKK